MYICGGCDNLRDSDFDVPEELNGELYCEVCVSTMPEFDETEKDDE